MHEYSIIQALVTRVEQEARSRGATAVHGLRVSLGELSGVDPELLATAYETFKAGTVCKDATLELCSVKAAWRCRSCGTQVESGQVLRCTKCGAPARLAQGDEILLEQIDMEVP